jgi:methyl-accepting chemotaxis protein
MSSKATTTKQVKEVPKQSDTFDNICCVGGICWELEQAENTDRARQQADAAMEESVKAQNRIEELEGEMKSLQEQVNSMKELIQKMNERIEMKV